MEKEEGLNFFVMGKRVIENIRFSIEGEGKDCRGDRGVIEKEFLKAFIKKSVDMRVFD